MLPGSADLSQGSIEWAVGTREKAGGPDGPNPLAVVYVQMCRQTD